MISLMLAVTLATPAAPAPPDGTYTYVQVQGGKRIAHYVVSVKRSGSTIDVNGVLEPEAPRTSMPTVQSHADVDATTLDLRSYHELALIGCGAMPYDLTVNGSTARAGDRQIAFPGIEHYMLDDARAVPLFLPAELALWSDARAVSIVPEGGPAHVVEPYPMAGEPARPASVPAGDRYVALHELGSKTGSSGLWYDPQTMIVDEVDTATAQWLRKATP